MKIILHFFLLLWIANSTSAQRINLYDRKENRMANSYFPLYNGEAIRVDNGSVRIDVCSAYQVSHSINHGVHGGANHIELLAAISDRETGELLFYSDGDKIFNRNHQVMLNGDAIYGCPSSNMGAVIVPFPNDKNKYYFFTTTSNYHEASGIKNLIYYSVIDMNLDNGMGGVVAIQKNIILDTENHLMSPLFNNESLNVIAGENCDYWLVRNASNMGDMVDMNSIKTYNYEVMYHITETGISKVFISDTMDGASVLYKGDIKNPVLDIFVQASSGYYKFFKFDYENGKHKPLEGGEYYNLLRVMMQEFYGVVNMDFSKDGKYFYFMLAFEGVNLNKVYRFEITGVTETEVQHPALDSVVINGADIAYMKLINDTIFLVDVASGGLFYINDANGAFIIENHNTPINIFGAGHPIVINTADVIFPTSKIRTNRNVVMVCSSEQSEKIDISPSDDKKQYDYWIWNTGDTGTVLNVDFIPGDKYWLTYSRFNGNCREFYVDTFTLKDSIIDGQPMIQVREKILLVDDMYESYQWLLDGNEILGATTFEHRVEKNGVYQIRTTLETPYGFCEYLSEPYRVNNATSIANYEAMKLKVYPSIVENGVLNIEGNATGLKYKIFDMVGKELQQGIAERQIRLQIVTQGMYYIELYNGENSVLKERFILK